MTDRFLSASDAKRALNTLRKLSQHDISGWAVAGGLAVEVHILHRGLPNTIRTLNDIDFVTPAFDCVPVTLAANFLFRHVHPCDPPEKTILQLVDPQTALRVDLFRAYGSTMARTLLLEFPVGPIRIVSAEDVLARTARLLMDLRADVPVAAKHACDYLRLAKLIETSDLEAAWQDHRKPDHPLTFAEANTLIRTLIAGRQDLLITPDYSRDATQMCSRCAATPAFPLADPQRVFSVLGYC